MGGAALHRRMTVTRIVVPPESLAVGEVVVPESAARHARVARVREGDGIELLDLAGTVAVGRLVRWEGKGCLVRVESLVAGRGEPPEPLVLGLGLLHTGAFDWAVEKATELGATEIVPVLAARVQRKAAAARTERWERIAAAAVAQCGRSRPPVVRAPAGFAAFLDGAAGARVIADFDETTAGEALATGGRGIVVLVGPEGGFTGEEVERAIEAGFRRLALGPRTLRAETAAVAALAVAQHRAGWW